MSRTNVFTLQNSLLNEFLFAPVGTEANGMTLTMISVLARLGYDPWLQAAELAKLPKPEATESLAQIIANTPNGIWPLLAAKPIAARLVTLLPTLSRTLANNPSSLARGPKSRPSIFIVFAIMLVCFAYMLAFQASISTKSNSQHPEGNRVTSLATPPHPQPSAIKGPASPPAAPR